MRVRRDTSTHRIHQHPGVRCQPFFSAIVGELMTSLPSPRYSLAFAAIDDFSVQVKGINIRSPSMLLMAFVSSATDLVEASITDRGRVSVC